MSGIHISFRPTGPHSPVKKTQLIARHVIVMYSKACILKLPNLVRCITTSPFVTYHRRPKVNPSKTMAGDDEDSRRCDHSCLLWHPHKMVLCSRRDNPVCFCKMPRKLSDQNGAKRFSKTHSERRDKPSP